MRRSMSMILMSLVLVVGCDQQSDPNGPIASEDYEVLTVVEGLEHPWGMVFLPAGDGILVSERPGRLRLIRDGELEPEPISGVPEVWAEGQGGLLDVALHPNFDENRLVYLSYSKPGDHGATTAVARGRLEAEALVDVQDVLVAEAWASGGQHFGSRIIFDGAGFLYVTVGDRGGMARAQDLGDHAGTTLRVLEDGGVPEDNPFVDRADALDEIFTYGNRNAQGMAIHPERDEVWQNEHGPRGGDELNRIVAGGNYGWPEYNFGDHYDGRTIPDPGPDTGTVLPLLHWTPAIAPSGMAIYDGNAFPEWAGDVFVGALAGEHLRRIRFDGTAPVEEEALLAGLGHRIRAVSTGPDGFIYVLVDAPAAPLLRLEPSAGR